MEAEEIPESLGLGFLLGAGSDCGGAAHLGEPGTLRRRDHRELLTP